MQALSESALQASITQSVQALAAVLRRRGLTLATAESCTGGLIAASCTSLEGSSDWFERGFVTYSNQAKTEMLGVPAHLIQTHGAVSEAVVRAMASGALLHSPAHWSMAVTGIAGPGGGSADKPVGTVWLAWANRRTTAGEPHIEVSLLELQGDRSSIRNQTVALALKGLLERSSAR